MTFEEFEKFQAELHTEIMNIGASKGKEYSHDADRFANFRRLAKQLDLKDYQIGWVYATKHLDSIISYIKEGKTFSTETIRGRFMDAILYLELIAGMVEDSEWNKTVHNGRMCMFEVLCQACGKKFLVPPEFNAAQPHILCGACHAQV